MNEIKTTKGSEIYEEINKIYQKDKSITPEKILEQAKNPNHPLHKHFEWDDEIAGNKYRLIQARNLIRKIILEITNEDNQKYRVRAFLSVSEVDNCDLVIHGNQMTDNYYVSLEDIEKDDKLIEYQKLKALSELRAFKIKYGILNKWLGKIFEEIDKL